LAAAGLPGAAMPAPNAATVPIVYGGVRMGVCLYDFRDIVRIDDQDAYLDRMVDACRQVGVGLVEINAPYLEPKNDLPFSGLPRLWDPQPPVGAGAPAWTRLPSEELHRQREALRQWRLTTSPSYFIGVRRKFEAAGLTPFSYVMTFTPDMTDTEIDAIFRQARLLGATVFSTNQTKIEMVLRLAPLAERYGMDIGFHNHTTTDDPNEVATFDSFKRLFTVSPRIKANLDIGHFVAANQDALAFLREYPDRITHLHMKDRKRDQGPGTVWGEGDAPLKDILRFVRDNRPSIPAIVEYEYHGAGTGIVETERCVQFMKAALA
jgi:sugar phosphate isomerase/epimerase